MKIINFPVAQLKIHLLLFLLLVVVLTSTGAWAKSTAPDAGQKSAPFEINKDTLKAKIDAINSREGIDEATKS